MSIYLDVTEIVAEPYRTGIQRVTAELCRNWPDAELEAVTVQSDSRLLRLPKETTAAIGELFNPDSRSASTSRRRLAELSRFQVSRDSVTLTARDVLLCPEVFFESPHVDFYERQPAATLKRACFIVYDLLPLTNPEFFRPNAPQHVLCRYFCLLRRIGHLSFISRATQRVFSNRFVRSIDTVGQVSELGCDGLGPRVPMTDTSTRPPTFVALGTIEPRKNHSMILDAFERIWTRGSNVHLTFLGRFGWVENSFRARIDALRARHPHFQVIEDADDSTVRNHVLKARATIFVSSVEGFGLPPVESLWLGTPVIASSGIPSLENIGSKGIHMLESLEPESLQAAVESFFDDSYHRNKCLEARELQLPIWDNFARGIHDWVRQVHLQPRNPS